MIKKKRKAHNAYPDDQVDFILDNYKGISNIDLAKLFNERFGTNRTPRQLNSWKSNRGLDSGLTGQFEAGHTPINKGTKGMFNVGGNKTSFKKGQRPPNYRPVGSERICSREGWILVKVQDHGRYQDRWKLKHRIMWEEENGPIPDKHRLIFLNGDRQDVRLDNLALTTFGESAVMSKLGMFDSNPEITKVGLSIAKLTIGTSDKSLKERKGSDKK